MRKPPRRAAVHLSGRELPSGPPHGGASRSHQPQDPCGISRPLLLRGQEDRWSRTRANEADTSLPAAHSKKPMGVNAQTPFTSNTCPSACGRRHWAPQGGGLSSCWLPSRTL
jgi:hypothetical protein